MKKIELNSVELTERVIELVAGLEILQERVRAQQLVLSWLLARQPDAEGMRFLSNQANELDDSPKFEGEVALLDELREDVAQWHAQWSPSHKPRRS